MDAQIVLCSLYTTNKIRHSIVPCKVSCSAKLPGVLNVQVRCVAVCTNSNAKISIEDPFFTTHIPSRHHQEVHTLNAYQGCGSFRVQAVSPTQQVLGKQHAW